MRYGFIQILAAVAVACALAGCSSLSLPSFDLSSAPPQPDKPVQVQLESKPSGATATLSDGPSCKTPCALEVVPRSSQSVTFALDRHLPQTVALQIIQHPGKADFFGNAPTLVDIDPNPVYAELQPAAPARKARRVAPRKKPVAVAPAAAPQDTASPPATASSPFPLPPRQR